MNTSFRPTSSLERALAAVRASLYDALVRMGWSFGLSIGLTACAAVQPLVTAGTTATTVLAVARPAAMVVGSGVRLHVDTAEKAAGTRPGCVELDANEPDELTPFASPSATDAEYWLGTTSNDCPKLALSLAGGGSKAGPYAMGVLEGMLHTGLIDHTQIISSVSGGGYAALWFYTELMRGAANGEDHSRLSSRLRRSTQDMLSPVRCLPNDSNQPSFMTREVFERTGCKAIHDAAREYNGAHVTPREAVTHSSSHEHKFPAHFAHALFPQQAHMRYFQDVIARRGSWDGKGASDTPLSLLEHSGPRVATQLGLSAAALPMHYAANGLFDLQRSFSPTAWSYRHGILRAYGMAHNDYTAESDEMRTATLEQHRLRYSASRLAALYSPPRALSYDSTAQNAPRAATNAIKPKVPYWLVNASSAESRFFWGWLRPAYRSASKQLFEIGADRQGSGEYGFHKIDPAEFDASNHGMADGAFASAAFLDAEQLAFSAPGQRVAIAAALYATNQNWGVTIENRHPASKNMRWQQALPWPLYYIPALFRTLKDDNTPAPYVHLIDGGNTENLGLYSLLRRGTQMIVIADEASDRKGQMHDLCNVKNQVELIDNGQGGPRYWLAVPALAEFDKICNMRLVHHYNTKSHLATDQSAVDESQRATPADVLARRRSSRLSAEKLCAIRGGRWVIDQCQALDWDNEPKTTSSELGYPIHAWPSPFISGCVLRLDSKDVRVLDELRKKPNPCRSTDGVRIHSRLMLLKPAIDLARWGEQFAAKDTLGGRPIKSCWSGYAIPSPQQLAAAATSLRSHATSYSGAQALEWAAPTRDAYGCEAALFIKVNLPQKRDGCPTFPQHSTTMTTLDSSQYIYAANKDLAHWQAAQLGGDLTKLRTNWEDGLMLKAIVPVAQSKHAKNCGQTLSKFYESH